MSEFIQEGKLTDPGRNLAGKMIQEQCDRRPCSMCSRQNKDTHGPGGFDCPAEDKPTIATRAEVDEILTLYLGRAPGLETFESFLTSLDKRVAKKE